ncbi:MAG: hypothetical protein JJE47_16310 [Acidimicrobiia bacterium]|nr:hypothetical protein [Acidimicrobiia bacterium]
MSSAFVTTPVLLTGFALIGLLVAEKLNNRSRLMFKTLASLGFIWSAIAGGLPASLPGTLILVGLCLSFIGDVMLVFENQFLVGLVAFAAAHLAYAAGFMFTGVNLPVVVPVAAIAVVAFLAVRRWLLWRVTSRLQNPVLGYMLIISVMLVAAAGSSNLVIYAGAALFYLSDLAVARHRFVAPGLENKLIGLPLYYAAQLILASTVN